ncbi:MAG: hypothetical protein P4M11_13165 [Candidatus Pacebacteria bacterium]|nr:hypothetical protein [Candidatus Paceibacterota bacterium]
MAAASAKFEETKTKVREAVLVLLQQPDEPDSPGIGKQIIEILGGIARQDFPAKWESLVRFLLGGLETIRQQIIKENEGRDVITTLSPSLVGQMLKFIAIYKTVIKEQGKKKMMPSKAHFYKLAKSFLQATHSLVTLFDAAMQRIFSSLLATVPLSLGQYNENVLRIGYSLDKILLSVTSCGFNPTDLITQEATSPEPQLIQNYIDKLGYYMALVENIYKRSMERPEETEALKQPFNFICKSAKGIFDKLSDIQFSEPVVMYKSLDKYLTVTMNYVSVSVQSLFPEELQRACLLCLHQVLNTIVYNDRDIKSLMSSKYSGIVASPVKFRNLEVFMLKSRDLFVAFFAPATVVNLFDLIVSRYLPLKSISLWETDPEAFIEQEDDPFTHEFESDRESSMSYLAYNILEQLLTNFPAVCAKQVKKYVDNLVSGKMKGYDILLQDAIYNAIEMLPKIYGQHSIEDQPDLKPEAFLKYLEGEIVNAPVPIQGNILKRRYIILITKWLDYINRIRFFVKLSIGGDVLNYLGNVVKIMCSTSELVLKFHCCMALRKILMFLEGAHLKRNIYGDSDGQLADPKESGPILAELRAIEKQINYVELLGASARVIIDVLNSFTMPKLVWAMINLLTLLVEKCQFRCNENVLAILENTNFLSLLNNKYELIQDALVDMCKALVRSFPSSAGMLKLSLHVVDVRLTVYPSVFNANCRRVCITSRPTVSGCTSFGPWISPPKPWTFSSRSSLYHFLCGISG